MSDERIDITVDSEVRDTHFLYDQRTDRSRKTLDYDYKRCSGCGICIEVCPKKAIEPGPLIEIATGLDAPPVIIDHTRCSFCGMCAAFCPVGAIRMTVDDKDILELSQFPHLDSGVIFNDKCLPCMLCKKACPEEAIDVEFTFQKKEAIAPFKTEATGEIEVNVEKCTLCGLCMELCPAFVLVEKKAAADDLVPFSDLLVDRGRCDYCGICVPFCPEDAIKVRGDFDDEDIKKIAPEITGNIRVDNNRCTRCGWCEAVCPYDAAFVTKPFDGEIELIDAKLKGCDPVGCHGCFNVCPSKAWIIPQDRKIDVVRDFCTYCGACERACHIRAIGVKRTGVRHTDIADTPWAQDWKRAITCLTTEKRGRPELSRTLSMEKAERKNGSPNSRPDVNHEFRKLVDERIGRISSLLGNKQVRRTWEKKDPEVAAQEIKKRLLNLKT
ncbi:NADH:ubiquinone oxidoreductase chain I-like protein [Candidatus Methanoperedens nitroreducens]|uniref:NADH:ubiquinone oxidoreductase chain I-like protein n=1 Tax=Candidatus Methanoperedens nitratireducens TaxID=1392998 RepID=A0A062VA29_9EURY|nr:4Fe-4S binding protein [Candidatus Methanoperedens nitroreducens]KCZ72579.1 NADH:ubiquinone oxidoreductase chain I-like protein [Candidatus Methanoperedens nitroreducens]MDJ1423489.1 4Fe-4S binding protein [Candidatus Methanoperedens sp.]